MNVSNPLTADTGRYEVMRVDFAPSSLVTEHPVEFGGEVSDHVQVRPFAFTVESLVTGAPRGVIPAPFAIDQAIAFWERNLGQQLNVIIEGEGTFLGVVLESFNHSMVAASERVFVLRFRQIRIASAISVPIPPRLPAPPAAAGAPTEQPLGQLAGAAGGVPTSALKSAADASLTAVTSIGGLIGGLF